MPASVAATRLLFHKSPMAGAGRPVATMETGPLAAVDRARKDERRRIPGNFPFDRVPGLSREVVQRLTQVRPDTLGQALRVPGVTPAAVAVLSAYVGRFSGQFSDLQPDPGGAGAVRAHVGKTDLEEAG